MRALRFYTDRILAPAALIIVALYLSYSVSAFIQRLSEPPRDMVALAGLQLESGIVGIAIAAALSALIASRHNRYGGKDILASSSRPEIDRVLIQFIAAYAPVLGGWLAYVIGTTVAFGITSKLLVGSAAVGVGALALAACCAIGQVIGVWFRPALAVPVAFISAYFFAAFFAIFGDDYWWQWLGPAFGDSFSPQPYALWLVGEYFWFSGLTVLLLGVNLWITAAPRRPGLVLYLGIAISAIGATLLAINGSDASPDLPLSLP
ncbi:hypothetical protein ACGFIK_25510 [Micromonospora sp. NPDC048871]|uniref:hypothetical protein n=1 Tax=unclassified Micromonospora TaxID=2617518 RepID=UPI002E0F457B|nr:hypothetical protein OIE53_01160 [Micromonospora sp. NBC_01739]